MNSFPWLLTSIALALLALLIVFAIIYSKKGKKHEIDYYNFFIMGIIWLGAGIPLGTSSGNWGLFIMGIAFMVMGLAHKKEWNKNRLYWENLPKKQRKIRLWTLIILGLLVLSLALFVFFV
jgi:hypothetical protein